MTMPPVGPRFRLAPGVVLRRGGTLPLPPVPGDEPAETDSPRGADHPDEQAPRHGHAQQRPGRSPGMAFRNTRWDRPSLAINRNPGWLLAPLFARDAAGLIVTPTVDAAANRAAAATPPIPGPLTPGVSRLPTGAVDLSAAGADWPTWWSNALSYRPGTPAPRPKDLFAGSRALGELWSMLDQPFRAWHTALGSGAVTALGADVERDALTGFAARTGRAPGRWTVRILQIPVTDDYLFSPEPRRIVVSAALRADRERYAAALAAELPRHF